MGTAGGQDKEGRREGKLAITAPFHGSSMVSGSGFCLWLSSSGLGAGSSRTSRTGRGGWSNSSGFRFRDLSCFSLGAIVTSSYAGSLLPATASTSFISARHVSSQKLMTIAVSGARSDPEIAHPCNQDRFQPVKPAGRPRDPPFFAGFWKVPVTIREGLGSQLGTPVRAK